MMIQANIAAILDTPVFGGQLYYIQRPDPDSNVSGTYAVFSIVGGSEYQTLEGDNNLSQVRVQISIYATDPAALVTKVAAVKAAMQAASALTATADPDTNPLALYNYSANVPIDGFEQETRRFYSHMDFYCWINNSST